MRMDRKDFDKLMKFIQPTIDDGVKEHDEYIRMTNSPERDTSEILIRETLENVLDAIKQFLIDEYDFVDSDFDNFPSLDQLIYHENGWSIRSSVDRHYDTYNKIRDKDALYNLKGTIKNESRRLCYTVFDTGNEKAQYFKFVTIGGEDRCGNCGVNYGTFRVGSGTYTLPPYHEECLCWCVYHD